MGAVLLGLLGHQADVRDIAHGGRVEGAVLTAVVHDRGVHRRVAAVGDAGEGLLTLTLGIPHAAGVADHDRHRGVDDDEVAGVQVGDAVVGIDHGQGRTGQEGTHRVSEEDRVGDLHHRRLEVDRPQQVLLLGQGQGGGIELVEGIDGHVGGVDDLSLEGLDAIGEGGLGAVSPDENDVEVLALGDEGLLVVEEVPMIHVGDASLDLIGPLTHAVRMGLGVRLDGGGGTTVRVTLTQHRVDGRAEHGGVAGGCLLLLVGGGLVREIRQVVSPGLQLSDRGLEMFGSLMMLASGEPVSSPSSARWSATF